MRRGVVDIDDAAERARTSKGGAVNSAKAEPSRNSRTGTRNPAKRLLALFPLKKTPTVSPPELPLPLKRKLIYFVPLESGLARLTVVWLPAALCW